MADDDITIPKRLRSHRPEYPEAIPPTVEELIEQMVAHHPKPAAPPPQNLNNPLAVEAYTRCWYEYELVERLRQLLHGGDEPEYDDEPE